MTEYKQMTEQEKLDKTAAMLALDGWTDLMYPRLGMEKGATINMLLAPENMRKPAFSDEWLRGRIAGLEFAMEHWKQSLDAAAVADVPEKEYEPVGSVYGEPPAMV